MKPAGREDEKGRKKIKLTTTTTIIITNGIEKGVERDVGEF